MAKMRLHLLFLTFFGILVLATRSVEGSAFRIIDGRPASSLEFPYQITLERRGYHWCGGSIINKDFVLTAAHCVKWAEEKDPVPLLVRAGHDYRVSGGVVRRIKKVIPHEKYEENAKMTQYDIALLKMNEPYEFTDRIQPIQLAQETPKEDEMSWVTGFGHQDLMRSAGKNNKQMMAVELPIISLENCKKLLFGVAEDMICAGFKTGHRDACRGDSGGPLAVNNILSGVVSWGIGCGREGYPGVYTNVAFYYNWIQEKMKANE